MKAFLILLFFHQIFQISCLSGYVLEEKIENCNNGSLKFLDISTIKFTMLNDSNTVVNGKWIFKKLVSSKWVASVYGERYDRGQWNLMVQKKYDDFCNYILNPTEM